MFNAILTTNFTRKRNVCFSVSCMLVSGVCLQKIIIILQKIIRITDGNYFYYDNQEFVWVWNDKEIITILFSPALFFPISYCYFVNRYFSTISLTIVVISLLVVPIYLIPLLLVPCNLSLLAILFILIIINITFTIHKLHIVSPFCFVLFSVILTIEEMEMECALCHAIVVCLNY